MTHKNITAQEHITIEQADTLVRDHGWCYRWYYNDTARWLHICEPAKDGQRADIAGAIWYTANGTGWDRHMDETHPAVIEQIALDKRRREALSC